ncbi:MAG: dihydropteroate synthase [SAR202 cluster bacterium]|nr:dihydropteroate synthase [Dehalococcoidia bacterium]MQG45168.1 dihydropteroate synthase [SAR202 cluster bacterium]
MTQVQTPLNRLAVASGETLAWGVRTYVIGIINLTPDSFSGDGLGGDVDGAVDLALRFQDEGADILDIGAESTRPGHKQVSLDEELARLMPALEAVAKRVDLPISVDTYKAAVARRAVDAGAVIINDIWGLKAEPELAEVAAETCAGLVLMHSQKGTKYRDLVPDLVSSLKDSVRIALEAGVPRDNIIVDPGIGFGKTPDQNLAVLARLDELKELDCPMLVGTSRKSTLGLLLDLPAEERVEATAATVSLAIAGGADLVRVHDVKEMVRVCRVTDAVVRGWRPEGWKAS